MSYPYSNSEIKPLDKDQPLDTVAQIKWDPYSREYRFLACGWDGFIRYYQLSGRGMDELNKVWDIYLEHPVLHIDLHPDMLVFAGLASGDVLAVNMKDNSVGVFGRHDAPVAAIFWVKEQNILVTLGLDQVIMFWSLEGSGGNFLQNTTKLPYKTYAASFSFPYLLVVSNESKVAILNFKNFPNLNVPQYYQKINLEVYSKANCAKIHANRQRIMVGTVDGRTSIAEFKDTHSMRIQSPLVSRSQKKGEYGSIYGQINAVDLGMTSYECFAVIAGTQDIAIYNLIKKSKIKSLKSNAAITTATLSLDGKYIAYASGTDWTQGLHQLDIIKKPRIFVYKFTSGQLSSFVSK